VNQQNRIFTKCAWRLVPFMGLLYFFNFLDRVNAGFAALTMNRDLGFSPEVFGFGAGLLFVGYAMANIPSNVILERVGARHWVFGIMLVWGTLSASTAFVKNPTAFYILRFLLGIAEGGFFPGMIYYLTLWFPQIYRVRLTAAFMTAIPVSFIVGGPLSAALLAMDGVAGLHGWQWLFLLEAMPVFFLAAAVPRFLPNGPTSASFLTLEEKRIIIEGLSVEDSTKDCALGPVLRDTRIIGLGIVLFALLCAGYGVQLWLPQIVRGMGFSNGETGLLMVIPGVTAAISMYVWGRSSDRRGDRVWHLTVAILITAASFAIARACPQLTDSHALRQVIHGRSA
jgi:MFS transporter, ACS family, tartrate transporter